MDIESTEVERAPYQAPTGGALVVSLEGNLVQNLPLTGRVITIGRLPENGLVLPHPMVSRYHAEIHTEPVGPVVTDVGSSTGTFVGETRLRPHQPFLLEAGQIVRIGAYTLTYAPPPASAPPASPTTRMPAPHTRTDLPPYLEPPHTEIRGPLAEEVIAPVQARPRFPLQLPEEMQSRYVLDLPALFQDNDFLGRMLMIFEALWEPLERRQDQIAMYFDPRTSPATFLPWLASWLHLALDPHWPETRRRQLVAEAMELYRWRGTPYGLSRMIEVCTGITPVITEVRGEPFTFRIAVSIPPGSDARREVIEGLVRTHKPAHVGYVLEITS